MAEQLVADYGAIEHSAVQLALASSLVALGAVFLNTPGALGSGSVQSALEQSTAFHRARVNAVTEVLALQSLGVRQAVTDLIAADAAAAQAVS